MKWTSLACLGWSCLLLGCLGPRQDSYQSEHGIEAVSDGEAADRLWNATQETLRAYRFPIDRVDRQAGVITTLPISSKHFFEFWRKDAVTREDFWEATLNPIRRWVQVVFEDNGSGQWTNVAVEVHKERLCSLDRQFNSTAAAYEYFSDTLPATTGGRLQKDDAAWVSIGRDGALEQQLLEEILRSSSIADDG